MDGSPAVKVEKPDGGERQSRFQLLNELRQIRDRLPPKKTTNSRARFKLPKRSTKSEPNENIPNIDAILEATL